MVLEQSGNQHGKRQAHQARHRSKSEEKVRQGQGEVIGNRVVNPYRVDKVERSSRAVAHVVEDAPEEGHQMAPGKERAGVQTGAARSVSGVPQFLL